MKKLPIFQTTMIDLPVEAVVAGKKYIVLKMKNEHPIDEVFTKINEGQWFYRTPPEVKKSDIVEVQYSYTPQYVKKLIVKHL